MRWITFFLFLSSFLVSHTQEKLLKKNLDILKEFVEVKNLFATHKKMINKYKNVVYGKPVFLFRLKKEYICITKAWTKSPGGPWLMFWELKKYPTFFLSIFKEPDIRGPLGYWLYKCKRDKKGNYFFIVCIIPDDPRGEDGWLVKKKQPSPGMVLLWDMRVYKITLTKTINVKTVKGVWGAYTERQKIPMPSLEDIFSEIKKYPKTKSWYQAKECIKSKVVMTSEGIRWK